MSITQLKIKQRKPSYLDSSPRTEGILDILHVLSDQPLYFTQILKKSRTKYKPSFLKYLHYCETKGFIESYKKSSQLKLGRFRGEQRNATLSYYQITKKGRTLLKWLG